MSPIDSFTAPDAPGTSIRERCFNVKVTGSPVIGGGGGGAGGGTGAETVAAAFAPPGGAGVQLQSTDRQMTANAIFIFKPRVQEPLHSIVTDFSQRVSRIRRHRRGRQHGGRRPPLASFVRRARRALHGGVVQVAAISLSKVDRV